MDDIAHSATETTAPRVVSGKYLARVDSLGYDGGASATILQTLQSPTDDEFVAIYGENRQHMWPPTAADFLGGLPGEVLEIDMTWSLPRTGRKRSRRTPPPMVTVTRVLERSTQRVAARCGLFGKCGGCQLQHMSYADQLAFKSRYLRQLLLDAGLADAPVLPAVGCENPWNYRNHMRYSVDRNGTPGLTQRGSHRVLPVRNCPIAHDGINQAMQILTQVEWPRPQLLVRYSTAAQQLMLQPAPSGDVRDRLEAAGVEVVTDALTERLLDHDFRIRPSSFFQTNTAQANQMMRLVLEALPQLSDSVFIDAYCGVGTFAALMASTAQKVIAIEESASAIRDATINLHDSPNVTVLQGKVEDILPALSCHVDGLVIDPPRAGCQRPVLDALVWRHLPVVVYISCNPVTLARDLNYLCVERNAYRIKSVQPLDMFPQTAHIESITTLEAIR